MVTHVVEHDSARQAGRQSLVRQPTDLASGPLPREEGEQRGCGHFSLGSRPGPAYAGRP